MIEDLNLSFYDFKYGSVVNAHDTDFKNLDIIDLILTQFRKWKRTIVSQTFWMKSDLSYHWHNTFILRFWRNHPLDDFLIFKKIHTYISCTVLSVNAFELMPKESFDYKLGSLVLAGAWPWPFSSYMNSGDVLESLQSGSFRKV